MGNEDIVSSRQIQETK